MAQQKRKTTDGKELRYLRCEQIEVRARADDEENETLGISGYVVKWDSRSQLIWGYFYEKVAKGAFTRALEENVIKALWNHRTDYVLGSTKSGTLRLKEDKVGLYFEIDLPNNTWGKDAYESIQRGDVDGVSFGFYIYEDGDTWEWIKDEGVYERTLLAVNLFEVSPTPFPAYEESSEVSQRSLEKHGILSPEERREKEKIQLQLDLLGIGA